MVPPPSEGDRYRVEAQRLLGTVRSATVPTSEYNWVYVGQCGQPVHINYVVCAHLCHPRASRRRRHRCRQDSSFRVDSHGTVSTPADSTGASALSFPVSAKRSFDKNPNQAFSACLVATQVCSVCRMVLITSPRRAALIRVCLPCTSYSR